MFALFIFAPVQLLFGSEKKTTCDRIRRLYFYMKQTDLRPMITTGTVKGVYLLERISTHGISSIIIKENNF